MQLKKYDNHKRYKIPYGGKSCRKEMLFDDQGAHCRRWMLKFQGSNAKLRAKTGKDLPDQTNSAVNEWLGSHIYETLGIPVQHTELGYLNGELVVACAHIYEPDEHLYELRGMLAALDRELFERFNNFHGTVTDLEELLPLIRRIQDESDWLDFENYFWIMFVADAFIANTDRNLGNLGFILTPDGNFRRAPVYDNGSSFNCRLTEEQMRTIFKHWREQRKSVAFNSACPYRLEGKPLSPLSYIYREPCPACIKAIGFVVPRIDLKKCAKLVLELRDANVITKTQAAFYIATMTLRYRERLLPAYEQHFGPLAGAKAKPKTLAETKAKPKKKTALRP